MKTPIFLSFLLILIVCISQVQAVTVLNSRYSSGLSAGSSDSFIMTMKPDTPQEIGTSLTVGMDSGNCSSWVSLSSDGLKLVSGGTPVTASISIPKDATNGYHLCYAEFTSPGQGLVTSRIAVPFSINVTGGKEPTVTPIPPTYKTTAPTVKPTIKSPIQEVQVPISVTVTPDYKPEPVLPIYGMVIVGLIAVFLVVIIYDYRRGKQ